MKIERTNGIIDKSSKIWVGETTGIVNFKKQNVFIEILTDKNNNSTLSIGNDYNQIIVDVADVEELINVWRNEQK